MVFLLKKVCTSLFASNHLLVSLNKNFFETKIYSKICEFVLKKIDVKLRQIASHFVTNILITIVHHGNNRSRNPQRKKNNNIRINELNSVSLKFIVAISTNSSSIDWLMPSKGSHFDKIKLFHLHGFL